MSDLTPLTSQVKRRKFMVLDIESKDGDSQEAGFTRPFMCGLYDGEEFTPHFDTNKDEGWESRYWLEGGCIDLAMRHVLKKKYRGWHIYAHNGGRFDFLFLLPWLKNIGWKLGFRFSIIPVSSSIQVLDVWTIRGKTGPNGEIYRAHRWRFLDSFKLIPTSLDKAAKAFGQKGKVSHDLHLHENDPHWIEYNGADCTELYGVLTKFHNYVENVLLGEVGITAPSTAMKIFRRNYLGHSVPRCEETHDFVRSGYFGGRVEVFLTHCRKLRYFDINSSYPAAMLGLMPAGPATKWQGTPPDRFLDSYIGFCKVDITVPKMHIPPLPVRADSSLKNPALAGSGKLIFPVGKLHGIWEWSELQMALEMGATIAKWHESVWYEPVYLFREFVTELYKYRDKSRDDYDVGLAEVVKIMLNATYGKFGMKTLRKKIYCYDDPNMPDNAIPVSGDPDSLIWTAEEECDAPYIMPQVAARVTALARVRLYRAILAGLKNGGDVAYTDTDSVLTTNVLPTSTELGGLKDEIPEHSGKLVGHFLGPKTYILTTEDNPDFFWEGDYFEKVKAKGIEQKNQEVLLRLHSGERIFQSRLEKVGTLMREQFERGPLLRQVPRRILKTEGKRIVHDNGTTSPFKLEMW